MADLDPEAVRALVEQMRPLLAGHPAPLQGAVLADLLAIWLAGHIAPGHPAETRQMREMLLTAHIRAVRTLTLVNEGIMRGQGRYPDCRGDGQIEKAPSMLVPRAFLMQTDRVRTFRPTGSRVIPP